MPHLELEHISKSYSDDAEVLSDITLAAENGEFIVLVGPSGCGKSTTLRIIAGLERPDSGSLRIAGRDVTTLESKDRDIAMVFQNYALYPHLSVRENIAFPLKIRKISAEIQQKEIDRVSEMLSIGHLLSRKPKELSGGERQRVALGRAVVRKPQVFLFDEPLSNLDAALRSSMRSEIRSLQRSLGTTMVYVTHDQTEALTMGDRIAVLNKGKLEQFDTPEQIYRAPRSQFVASFIGSPTINLLNGTVEGGRFTSNEGMQLTTQYHIPQKKSVIAGIRPESLVVATTGDDPAYPNRINGTLTFIEPLGSTTNMYISAGSERLTVSVKGYYESFGSLGAKQLTLHCDPNSIILFDAATGKSI
jgi:multiple sugar transport system ATP-binding protein